MDRISNLPDSVLSHILSLLPTKLVASTCVLSKRWQFLWTMVHNFELEYDTCYYPPKKDLEAAVTSLFYLVNKFFTERDKGLCLRRFRLKLWSSLGSTHVGSLLRAAMSSHVEQVDVDFKLDKPTWFCCSIFACKTLVVLKLSNGIVVDAPSSSVHFPSLKVLHMSSVKYENHHSFSNLICGCPVLENLALRQAFEPKEFRDFVISSPTLRELVVQLYSWAAGYRVWAEAPSLEYLHIELFRCGGIYLKNLVNLVQAVVDVDIDDDNDIKVSHMVEDVFSALYNVQVLKLKAHLLKAVPEGSFEDLPVFHNLVQLELHGLCSFWPMQLSFLQKIPYLQHLTFDPNRLSSRLNIGFEAWTKLEVLNCLSHLRTLCFSKHGTCDDMEFVAHVLKNSTVLENMTITCWSGLSFARRHAFKQRLASIERGSKKCKLKFEGEIL